MSKIYYKIEEEELKTLLEAAFKLNALEAGGADNWEWCGDSITQAIDDYDVTGIDIAPDEEKDMDIIVRDLLLCYDVLEGDNE